MGCLPQQLSQCVFRHLLPWALSFLNLSTRAHKLDAIGVQSLREKMQALEKAQMR